MTSHGSTYEDYEREYQACLSQLRNYMASSRSNLNGSNLSNTNFTIQQYENECIRLLQNGRQLIIAMQGMAEIESNPDMLRIHTSKQILQRDIDPLYNEIQHTINTYNRSHLFTTTNNNGTYDMNHQNNGSGGSYHPPSTNYDSNNLTMSIQSSDDLLYETQNLLNETEQIGTNTILQLGQQREQLYTTTNNIQSIQHITYTAGTIIQQMSRKAFKNKVCLYCCIFLLSLLNIFVLYRIYKKQHK